MSGDDIRSRLEVAGQRFEHADRERAEASAELAELVREASGQLDKSEIARLARISRPTVYAMLKQEKP